MHEYEKIAEKILASWNGGDRARTMKEIDRLTRNDALAVVVIMAKQMTADDRERFTGFLVSLAIATAVPV